MFIKQDRTLSNLLREFDGKIIILLSAKSRGMHSTCTEGGKLVELEKSVVDFHQYLALKLFGADVETFTQGQNAAIFKI